jgi:RHS repeat-associated protein
MNCTSNGPGELIEAGTHEAYGATESDYRPKRWDSYRADYRVTGKEEDVEVGLEYFGKRYYARGLGRWVSADPLAIYGLGADLNAYAYVHGTVLRSRDPIGLQEAPSADPPPKVDSPPGGAPTPAVPYDYKSDSNREEIQKQFVIPLLAAFSRTRAVEFEVQLDETYAGEIRDGELDQLLRAGLLESW